MEKYTFKILSSIIVIAIVITSGCTQQTQQQQQQQKTGNTYSFMNNQVHISAAEGSLPQNTTLTVDTVATKPVDDSTNISTCYSFGPDRTEFYQKVTVTLPYDPAQYSADFPLSILSLFYYSSLQWNKVNSCTVDTTNHTVTGSVMHFCMIGVGYTQQDYKNHQSQHNQNNSSAIYTFEVPVSTYGFETNYTPWPDHPDEVDYTYRCGAYFVWDPQPYVRYYAVTRHFNGNPSHSEKKLGSCDYQDWGKEWCPLLALPDPEGYIAFLGPAEQVPNPNHLDYHGLYTLSSYMNATLTGFDPAKHGMSALSVYAQFDHEDGKTRGQIDAIEKEMDAFVQEYVQGWTVTVEPFT